MPYDANDVESLPKNVQGLDEHHRKMWSDVWNSAYEQHGDESKAFAIANGVLKKRLGHSTSEESNESTPKGIDGGDITGIGDLELPIYDPADPRSLEEAIFKEVGLTVEVKRFVLDDSNSTEVSFRVRGEAQTIIPRLLEYIGKIGAPGHSFEIVVDPDDSENRRSFGFDGDGSDRIDDIKVNGVKFQSDK